LQHHDWPGNVRELQNVVERAALNADGRTPVIVAGWLDRAVEGASPIPTITPPAASVLPDGVASAARGMTLEHMERDYISAVLAQTHWRVEGPRGAAVLLGLRPSTLRSRIKKLGLK
jgi:transcriptional regulator with GAF, ATPase, and Fis domain